MEDSALEFALGEILQNTNGSRIKKCNFVLMKNSDKAFKIETK